MKLAASILAIGMLICGSTTFCFAQLAPATAADEEIRPYTPGGTYVPRVANASAHKRLSAIEITEAKQAAAILGDPNRVVWRHNSRLDPLNSVAAGNGEAVGMWSASTFAAQGSVTNMGVQPNYIISNGDLFFHTHQFVNNQCFEYGINYSYATAYLFGYNWCTGGNTAQGFMTYGLVGPAGGAMNTWRANGNGWLLAWDSVMGIYKIALEEVLEKDGAWHLLGYNWTTKQYADLMNGRGVTGTKNACCGWDVFEEHGAPGSSCNFDPAFPVGQHLLYDEKKQVLRNGVWNYLDKVPGGWSYETEIDCADLSSNTSGYVSPFFSGMYYPQPATSSFGAQHAGDWWLTQR